MIIEWLGHASFKIKSGNKTIYIDPYAGHYDEKADIILITHSHYDHFSKETIAKIQAEETKIVCPADVGGEIECKIIQNNEKAEVNGLKIEAVPAYNLRSHNHPEGKGNGYIFEVEGKRIYVAGDTDLIPEMNVFEADICLLPIGGTYTMDATEAAAAAKIIQPKIAIPMHWGKITAHEEDAMYFKEEVYKDSDIEVKILKEGESIEI